MVADVSQHLSVERDLLYPAIRDFCENGDAVIERLRGSERRLEAQMAELESGATPERKSRLDAAIRDHISIQDGLFPELRQLIPASRLTAVLDTVPLSIGGAPTRAHPRLAEGGAMTEVVEDVASIADHLRDLAHPRGAAEPDQAG